MLMKKFLPLVALWSVFGCNNSNNSPRYEISEMPAILQKQVEKHSVVGKDGGSVYFENGSSVYIPPKSLVCNGKYIDDTVDIQFVQFTSPFEIFASGIPMQYDSAGTSYTFKSAGMFKLNAFYKGDKVELADGKEMNVQMASSIASEGYAVYFFDTIRGQWELKGKDKVTAAPDPQKSSEVYLEQDNFGLPKELQENERIIPITIQDINRYPTLKVYNSIAFEISARDFSLKTEVLEGNWSDMQIDTTFKKKQELTLLGIDKNLQIEGIVYLDGEPYEKAIKKYPAKKKEYEERIKRADSLARMQRLAWLGEDAVASREFAISGFGIWNCDAPLLARGKSVSIELKNESSPEYKEIGVAYISENSIFRLRNKNEYNTYTCKLLSTKHLFYASDENANIYVGLLSESASEMVRESSTVTVNLKKVTNPRLFFKDLENQIEQELSMLDEEPNEPMEKESIPEQVTIAVFPNPAQNSFKINLSEKADDVSIEIVNSGGRKVRTIGKYSSESEILIDNLPNGTYTVLVSSRKLAINKSAKLIVQH